MSGSETWNPPAKSKFLRVAQWFDDRRWHRVASAIWRIGRLAHTDQDRAS